MEKEIKSYGVKSYLGGLIENPPNVTMRDEFKGATHYDVKRQLRDLDSHNGFSRAYDSFANKPLADNDNLNKDIVSEFVTLSNFPERRRFTTHILENSQDAYAESLRASNLCNHCRLPLRIKYAYIIHIRPTTNQLEVLRVGSDTDKQAVLDDIESQFKTAREKCEIIRKTNRVGGFRAIGELTGLYKRIKISEFFYADVKSHYEAYRIKGETNLRYGLVCGFKDKKGTLIRLRSQYRRDSSGKPMQVLDYYDNEGDRILGFVPPESYRVVDKKCNCNNLGI